VDELACRAFLLSLLKFGTSQLTEFSQIRLDQIDTSLDAPAQRGT
jgi:hypothetical protein